MRECVEKHLDSVDGVVFDFGGVLVSAPQGEWKVISICKSVGLSQEATLKGIWTYRRDYDGGFINCREMYEKILADNGLKAEDAFFEEVYKADSEGWTNFSQETLELMKEIKKRGKKVGILSNMSADFYVDYFCKLGSEYRALCDSETISSHFHLTKPDRLIYDIAAQRMGISPERLLFLDDNEVNVQAARSFGWKSEVYHARQGDVCCFGEG